MIRYRTIKYLSIAPSVILLTFSALRLSVAKEDFTYYIVDPRKQNIKFYWKDKEGNLLNNFKSLRKMAQNEGQELVFATNGGIFMEDQTPLGLFIEDGTTKKPLNRSKGYGNFYLQPNGIFYITSEKQARITQTGKFKDTADIKYATQSGPMLITNGRINSAFNKDSESINIRSGVGILPGNRIIFAISRRKVNFYSFAEFFLCQGCDNALYLDGFVSKMYLPDKRLRSTSGSFGIIIGVTSD